jgi:hypothetical protein
MRWDPPEGSILSRWLHVWRARPNWSRGRRGRGREWLRLGSERAFDSGRCLPAGGFSLEADRFAAPKAPSVRLWTGPVSERSSAPRSSAVE